MANLVRYGMNPRRNFNSMFDEMANELMGLDRRFDREITTMFRMDVIEDDTNYIVEAELPGLSREEIDIELNEGRLNISASKSEEETTEEKNYLHHERVAFSTSRGVYLKDAAIEGVTATLEDGVLKVTVPKKDKGANSTKISID